MSNYPENDYRNYLEHSLGEWKVHKYIQKIGDRYIYPKTRKIATAVAGLSKKNRERKAYQKTGMNSRERALASARRDINSQYVNDYGPSAGYSGKNRRKTSLNRFRGRAANLLNRAVGALSTRTRRTKAYKTLDTFRQRAGNKLHSMGTNARNKYSGKNINRAIYRKTGINVAETARNTAQNIKRKARDTRRKAYRKTGLRILK